MGPRHKVLDTLTRRLGSGPQLQVLNAVVESVAIPVTDTLVGQQIATEVSRFIRATSDSQLWAWYGAYDHVAYAQLFGRMIDLPRGLPMFTCDLKQEAERLGNPRMPEQVSGQHNALEDARHNLVMARFLANLERELGIR